MAGLAKLQKPGLQEYVLSCCSSPICLAANVLQMSELCPRLVEYLLSLLVVVAACLRRLVLFASPSASSVEGDIDDWLPRGVEGSDMVRPWEEGAGAGSSTAPLSSVGPKKVKSPKGECSCVLLLSISASVYVYLSGWAINHGRAAGVRWGILGTHRDEWMGGGGAGGGW